MPGCDRINESLHMTIHTAVLVDTLKSLSSDLRWRYCNIFFSQDHTVAFITHDAYASVFY